MSGGHLISEGSSGEELIFPGKLKSHSIIITLGFILYPSKHFQVITTRPHRDQMFYNKLRVTAHTPMLATF